MYSRLLRNLIPYYVTLFSFFIVSQLGKHFFFPFSYLSGIRIDYLAPTFYFVDMLSLPFLIYAIKKLHSLYPYKITFTAILIFFLVIINLYFSLSPQLWFYSLARFIQWTSIFYFFKSEAKNKSIFSAVLYGFLLGGIFELALSLFQLSARHSFEGWIYYLGERRFTIFTPGIAKAYFLGREFLRPYGTFSHPNSLAGFYLLLYSFILTHKRVTNIFFKTFFLAITSALVFISFSRTAIIIYVLINILYFFRQSFSCRLCHIAKIVTAIVLIFFAFGITGDNNSYQKRNDFAQKSLSIIAQNPFTGTGMGSYLIAQHRYPQKFVPFFEQPVHNIFLLIIAQLGIPLSGILFFSIYRYIERYLKKIYILLPLACVLLTGSVDHYWITLQQNVLVTAVIFGILFIYETTSSRIR